MKKFREIFFRYTQITAISVLSIYLMLSALDLALEHGTAHYWAVGIASCILAIVLLDTWNWIPNLNEVDKLNRQLEELKKEHAKLIKEHG